MSYPKIAVIISGDIAAGIVPDGIIWLQSYAHGTRTVPAANVPSESAMSIGVIRLVLAYLFHNLKYCARICSYLLLFKLDFFVAVVKK